MSFLFLGNQSALGRSTSSVNRGTQSTDLHNDQLPTEYQRVQAIVDRLARHNDLGERPLLFTIVLGSHAGFIASELHQNEKAFHYYSSLSPYAVGGDETTAEIKRQAEIFGDWEAYAYSNGTVALSLSTFRVTHGAPDDVNLACTIAHELSHILDHHIFQKSHELSIKTHLRSSRSVSAEEYEASISRKYEAVADQMAWEMVFRSGYSSDSCIDTLTSLHQSIGHGAVTQPSSTHPGFAERRSALEAYVQKNRGRLVRETLNASLASKKTKGIWEFRKDKNYLQYTQASKAD